MKKTSIRTKVNEVRQTIEGEIESRREILANAKLEQQLTEEKSM